MGEGGDVRVAMVARQNLIAIGSPGQGLTVAPLGKEY